MCKISKYNLTLLNSLTCADKRQTQAHTEILQAKALAALYIQYIFTQVSMPLYASVSKVLRAWQKQL